MTLTELFFSFAGRINRQLFVLGMLGLFSLQLGLFSLVAYEMNLPVEKAISREVLLVDTMLDGLLMWPTLALSYKRMHDRNKSGKLFGLVYATATVMAVPVALGSIEAGQGPVQAYFFLHFMLMFGVLMMLIEMAFYPGTAGPNRYGDDPLNG